MLVKLPVPQAMQVLVLLSAKPVPQEVQLVATVEQAEQFELQGAQESPLMNTPV